MAIFLKMHLSTKSLEDIEIEQNFIYFLLSLYKNGQIYFTYDLIKENSRYVAYVTVPEKNALDIGYMNKYSLLDLEHISFDIEIIGTNTDMMECCNCTHITSYFLKTNYADYESPLKCGKCGGSIPLYKIPYIMGEEEHYSILSWARNYYHVDHLWMSCLADRFTKRQLTNHSSQLFIDAMVIRKELEKVLEYPVYYFVYYSNKVPLQCPLCSSKWEELSSSEYVDFLCRTCLIATDKE